MKQRHGTRRIQEHQSHGTSEDDDGSEGTKKTQGSRMYYGEGYGEDLGYCIGIGPWASDRSDDESLSVSNYRVLNLLESGSSTSVLEDLYEEIVILKHVIGAPVVSSWDFTYKTLEQRYSESRTPDKLFPEVDSTPLLTSPLKLQRDRTFIENVIKETLATLLEDGTFEPICEAVETLNRMHRDDTNLIQEVKKNLEYLKDLKERVKEKDMLDDMEEKERDELLYKLQDEIDDVILKCSIERNFVDKWEETRGKQNKWRLADEENFYRDKIKELTEKSSMEKRVNESWQTYIKGNQAELEEQLEEWMSRYDAEMERRENKILQLRYMRDQTEEEVKRLENLYNVRRVEMAEWIKFRELRKRRTAASLIIQSWWRGFMLRKKLGPYKEKKQKSEKPKKKK